MNDRIRFLESEMAGEKIVTRHILDRTQRNTEEIAAVRVEITTMRLVTERTAADVTLVKAAQMAQGSMLNILAQDVREMRTEMGQMRTEMRTEMGQMRAEMRTETAELRTRLDAMEKGMDARFDAVLAAIHTVAPHAPPSP